MNELEEVWAQMLDRATKAARAAGRGDVADYLDLKAANDLIRRTSVKWLFDSLTEIASRHNRSGFDAAILIENENPHNFPVEKANMVGSLLRLRQGVRCLTIESGWTRTPADGFMRGGALAAAKITHFGISRANEELILTRANNLPQWFSITKSGQTSVFDSSNLQRHFQIFTGKN